MVQPQRSVRSESARANDPIDHTTNDDPIVVHEDHHEPVPIPARAAEEAPIYQNRAEAELAARPPGAQRDGVPVISLGQNDPQATQTAALYRQPGSPHPPPDTGVIKASQPPGDEGVQLVEGINNRDLYALVRRFNTQINSVRSPARNLPSKEPDLRMTSLSNAPYRSDTLKSNFERLVATLGPSMKRGVHELQRLRDWSKETRRTAAYCISYFAVWFFGYAVLAVCFFLAVLMCFPSTRRYLFPEMTPAPGKTASAADPTNQEGDESLMSSSHPGQQRTKGEQAEEQGFETRAMIEAYAQAIVVGGTHRSGDPIVPGTTHQDNLVHDEKGNVIGRQVDSEDHVASGDTTAKVGGDSVIAKPGKEKEATNQAVKRKRDQIIQKWAKFTETSFGAVADAAELLYNSCSPPTPYPDSYSRFKLAALFVLLPGILVTFVPAKAFGRVTTFLLGEVFWGWPINSRVLYCLAIHVPNWPELLDLRNSILSGCPTNAQLTLHLFRVSEGLNTPLPPPPENSSIKSTKNTLQDTSPANPSGKAVPEEKREMGVGVVAAKVETKSKHQLSNALKKMSKRLAGVHGDVAVDGHTKPVGSASSPVTGNREADNCQINNRFENKLIDKKFGKSSPDAYGCKLDGKGGHLILDEESGRVGWVRVSDQKADGVWDIASIVQLSKDSVAVPRMALGLVGGVDVSSLGLIIRFTGETEGLHFKSVERREQLFNRLLALGPQRWEIL